MSYKAYPSYKDSGVEWLGAIPEEWEPKRLRFVGSYQNSNVDKKSYEDQKTVRLCNYTDVYYNEKITNKLEFMESTASDNEIDAMTLKHGDIIITKDSENPHDIGIPAIVSEDLDNVVCGYHLTVIRTPDFATANYLFRAIQGDISKAQFYVESPGVTRFGLNQDTIGSLWVALPPIELRSIIAAFLDRQTTLIDEMIEKKSRFIELLKEKRQALITHAITKGMNPDVKMKDSGVEWIGEIPEEWEPKRLRFIGSYKNSNVDKKSYEDQKPVRLCNYTDVYYNEKITNNLEFMESTASDNEIDSMTLKRGDIIITKDSEDPHDIGIPAIVSEDLDNVVCGYHLTVIRTPDLATANYLFRAIQGDISKAQFYVESPGVTRFGLNQETIGSLWVALPPIELRLILANFLDKQTNIIDSLISKTEESINLLKEKRSALITAAVTGKIDVREEA
jgi:type I restriction enzyme S subunit